MRIKSDIQTPFRIASIYSIVLFCIQYTDLNKDINDTIETAPIGLN